MYTSNLCSPAQTQADERTCDSSRFYYPTPCKFARIGLLLLPPPLLLLPCLWFSCCWSCIECDVRRLFSGISFHPFIRFGRFVSSPCAFLVPSDFVIALHTDDGHARTHNQCKFGYAIQEWNHSIWLVMTECLHWIHGWPFFLAKYWRILSLYTEPCWLCAPTFDIARYLNGFAAHYVIPFEPKNQIITSQFGWHSETSNRKLKNQFHFEVNFSSAIFQCHKWTIPCDVKHHDAIAYASLCERRNATNDIVATMITWRTVSIFPSLSLLLRSVASEFVMPVRRTSECVGRCSSHVRADWENGSWSLVSGVVN